MPPVEEKHLKEDRYQILTGRVLDIQKVSQPLYIDTTELTDFQKSQRNTYYLVTISIIKTYGHGISVDTIDIATGTMPSLDCGFPFEKNKEYLITLTTKNEDQEYYWTSICVPTKELSDAKKDMEFIVRNKE